MFPLVLDRPARAWWPGLLVVVLVVLAGGMIATAPTASAAQNPVSCANTVGLVNGSFEDPVLQPNSYQFIQQSQVPGWSTTATDSNIEIWRNDFNGVTAAVGAQHAELNATQPSALYQDLPTIPGTVMRWSLAHRGRAGVDTMAVNIGPADGTAQQQRLISDGTNAWGTYVGFYTVPDGQTTTRFAFAAVSTFNGNLSIGNFLDDVYFGTNACVLATQTVSPSVGGVYGQAGDVLTVTVNAASGGGSPALDALVRSSLPPGVSYVPGSLRVSDGRVTTSPSDGAGDDVGEYDPATRQVVVRVGKSASATSGGALGDEEASTVTYQVRVDPASSPATVTSESTVVFTDPLTNTTRTSTSNSVAIVLNPIADVAVTLARTSAGAVVAGSPVTYAATLRNSGGTSTVAGQDSAYGTRLTSQLPASLTSASATTPGGTCSVSGTVLTCDVGTLLRNQQRAVTLTVLVSPDAPPVAGGLVLGVRASTASRDLDPTNDVASVTDDVAAVADVGVTLTATPTTPVAGTDVTYTALLTNGGPSTARSLVLSDPPQSGSSDRRGSVPGGTCSVSREGTLQCSVPSLAPGASAAVTIVVRSAPDLTLVQNTVTVAASTPDPASANNTASVKSVLTAVADLAVALTVPAGNVPLGGATTYRVTVTNKGPSTAAGTRLTSTVPPGITVVWPTSPSCTTTGCTIPTLAPGASVVLSGTAQVAATAAPGRADVTVTATATTTDPNAADNTGTATVFVGAPSLQVSVLGAITDTRRTRGADVGDGIVWTYVVTNAGDVDVADLSVVLPGSTTAIQTTCQPGTLPTGATAACHTVLPQPVRAADVGALAVTTTVEVTATWVGRTDVRSPSAGGSLATVLPLVPTSATVDPALQLESSRTDVSATAPAGGRPGRTALLAATLLLAATGIAPALRACAAGHHHRRGRRVQPVRRLLSTGLEGPRSGSAAREWRHGRSGTRLRRTRLSPPARSRLRGWGWPLTRWWLPRAGRTVSLRV